MEKWIVAALIFLYPPASRAADYPEYPYSQCATAVLNEIVSGMGLAAGVTKVSYDYRTWWWKDDDENTTLFTAHYYKVLAANQHTTFSFTPNHYGIRFEHYEAEKSVFGSGTVRKEFGCCVDDNDLDVKDDKTGKTRKFQVPAAFRCSDIHRKMKEDSDGLGELLEIHPIKRDLCRVHGGC